LRFLVPGTFGRALFESRSLWRVAACDAQAIKLLLAGKAPGFLKALTEAIDAGHRQVVVDTEVSLEEAPAAIASRGSGGARGKTVIVI
jgi:NADPH:quinone reductase-like Zn-dependent oxidoreductase